MNGASPFAGELFGAQPERTAWFADAVLRRIDPSRTLRVLDVGCGIGTHVFAMATRLPSAVLRGIDISSPNIEQAERAKAGHAAADRIAFVCGDYLEHRGGAFDLIISDSSLHLIAGSTDALLDKIATDLAPGGLLIASLPNCGLPNRMLWMLRRLLAALRSRWLDELALAISVRWYRGRHDKEFLRQRIPYLYILPFRCEGQELRDAARHRGLEWCGIEAAPHDSVMQPVHVLASYRRVAAA